MALHGSTQIVALFLSLNMLLLGRTQVVQSRSPTSPRIPAPPSIMAPPRIRSPPPCPPPPPQQPCPPPPPPPYPPPPRTRPLPSFSPTHPPSRPPPRSTCPKAVQQIRICGNIVNKVPGFRSAQPCCSIIRDRSDADALDCLCESVGAPRLSLPPNIITISRTCGRRIPSGFTCP